MPPTKETIVFGLPPEPVGTDSTGDTASLEDSSTAAFRCLQAVEAHLAPTRSLRIDDNAESRTPNQIATQRASESCRLAREELEKLLPPTL